MIDPTDVAFAPKLLGDGEITSFQPFRFRRLFHKRGDSKVKEITDEKACAQVVMEKRNH
ncbi:hypothetical protein [Microbulbifer epialgicus]|uniref:Uncharacterized protein n=1 Tax=Microbulbifer epialgicus TaxID=393907 RepID=A0ABV4P7G8_9GAMM